MAAHAQPIPGMTIVHPQRTAQPGEVIVSYEVVQPKPGCCQCVGLSPGGWIAVVLLLIFFPCLAFIPCMMADCFEPQQRPVYGFPGQGPTPGQQRIDQIPVGVPVTTKPGMYPDIEAPRPAGHAAVV